MFLLGLVTVDFTDYPHADFCQSVHFYIEVTCEQDNFLNYQHTDCELRGVHGL